MQSSFRDTRHPRRKARPAAVASAAAGALVTLRWEPMWARMQPGPPLLGDSGFQEAVVSCTAAGGPLGDA